MVERSVAVDFVSTLAYIVIEGENLPASECCCIRMS